LNVTVAGAGYVGLVTGVCLAQLGHNVTCIDVDDGKVASLREGRIPIYEPGLEDLMNQNLKEGRLSFTANPEEAYSAAEIIIIAVGTPENQDGSANLTYVESVARDIGYHIRQRAVIATKSTVPIGTNQKIKAWIEENLQWKYDINVVSNPEFLREGSAIHDMFHADRIVIGTDDSEAFKVMETLYEKLDSPIIRTDIKSAEMIKYASNAFLATKISFINEIANICEKVGANIEEVALGIGQDKRIGPQFLRAGIGYGGSCFPKDTKALVQIAGDVQHRFELLEAVIKVNSSQQVRFVRKAKELFGPLNGKNAAILGLSFKPNTDDVREAASIEIANSLLKEGSAVSVYDPVSTENAKRSLGDRVVYHESIESALDQADFCIICTEWEEISSFPLVDYKRLLRQPYIFDGRNCLNPIEAGRLGIHYYSIGRKPSTNSN